MNYKRDLLKPDDVAALEGKMAEMKEAIAAKEGDKVKALGDTLDQMFAKHFPPSPYAAIRENCEVFLVALIVAVGVRTFFLQPFTIPTGSMQPTLNGIRGYVTQEAPPNPLVKALHRVVFGRTYVNVVSEADDMIVEVIEETRFRFFTTTKVMCQRQSFSVDGPARVLEETFQLVPGRPIRAGEVVARGYVNTGDHVFVDKMSFNFRTPQRSEVFVFNTQNVPTRENRMNPGAPSQFYIKRLAGLPGDQLAIKPPNLYLNGKLATEPPFQRVMAAKDGFKGYSNVSPEGGLPFNYLGSPSASFTLPPKSYFALGDNSFHSSDSRDWGVVPEENLSGHALFVFYPFTSHWGLIK